ncbi:hypothetical protein ACPYO6_12200 [Georgenia sp. Z1344]|uniref:hypothetical protein n=1 Tax=Georgenia sp. Z1344 TaxID=3416706 RepID=UPI003CF82037
MTGPLATRPGLTRALAAVRSGEIGLLRAVALDLVATGPGDALSELGPDAIEVLRGATGPTSVTLQAHASADTGAATFLGRADHGVAVSAHLSLVAGERREYLRAAVRIVGTHGSVLVDLLSPELDVRTAAGVRAVPFGLPGADVAPDEATETLSAIAGSARSGATAETSW